MNNKTDEITEPPGDAAAKEEKPTFRFVLLKAAAQIRIQHPDLLDPHLTERSWDLFDQTMYETIALKVEAAKRVERRPLLAKIAALADVLRACQLPHKTTCPAGSGQGQCICGADGHNRKIHAVLTDS